MNVQSALFKLLEYYGTHLNHRGKWIVHQQLRRLLQADVNQDIEVVRDGVKWLLNPSDYVHQDVFWYGAKDYWDLWHIVKMVKEGDTIFDVGANFGYYSLYLAKTLARKCSIYAFEPSPDPFRRLQYNIRINSMGDCITPNACGLTDVPMSLPIRIRVKGNSGTASVVDPGGEGDNQGIVELVSLDEFVEQHRIGRIALLKIDVEGYEMHVLKGGRRQLPRVGLQY